MLLKWIATSQVFLPVFIRDKENFINHPKCRLINPAKSELGKVTKTFLDQINQKIRSSTSVSQWWDPEEVIEWFKKIPNKNNHTFISLNVVDFYPSITEDLLNKAISWAEQFITIPDEQIKAIRHTRKSLLFNDNKPWVKRQCSNSFDVTMGSYDGAEICKLVGLFILNSLKTKYGEKFGLYRDDGLIAFNRESPRLADKARKQLCKNFSNFGFKITLQTNMKIVNFLDITLNLNDGTYQPYRKPNNDPIYINNKSNHPPSIVKQLPTSINKRISKLSCNQETFNAAAPIYEETLRNSNFDAHLSYPPQTDNHNQPPSQKRNRSRNVIWYNPPFSRNVTTNIGRLFLNLIDKHFH